MLDTIVIIPTILAYVFITLLIVILSFIVIYISHRIYACISDNLPMAQAALSAILSFDDKSQSGIALRSPVNFDERKPKTALRIIVTLAPCYLAYVAYDNRQSNELATSSDTNNQNKIIKYYDRLSEIPIPEAVTTSSTRKLGKDTGETCTSTNFLASPTKMMPTKSVATSTTRLGALQELIEELEVHEEPATSTQGRVAQVVTVHNESQSVLRPSVTFANAINALANMKITSAEDL
ncbi:uncharacterized protein [Eurosta solidaginis]|uniref:uncharacterized protein n=1 Tax=Eurosta solidaginis TaxID=178769 RepID=UPI003530876E